MGARSGSLEGRLGLLVAARAVGVESLLAGLPLPVPFLFAVVTQLGDVWFYFLTLTTAYWVGDAVRGNDRRTAALLLGCALCALAVTTTLKGVFDLPRPPGSSVATGADQLSGLVRAFYLDAATAEGPGFPSGHALGSALVWGAAALTLGGSRRLRFAVGGLVVLLVGLSRLILGVHFLVDVLVGWAVGGFILAFLLRVGADRKPGRALSLAALVALVGAIGNFDVTHLTVFGATLGARIAWGAVGGDALRVPTTRRSGLALTAVGLPLLGVPFALLYTVDTTPVTSFTVAGLITAGVIVLPLVGDVTRSQV
jgi:membrane-associated phospholipid phosphatase